MAEPGSAASLLPPSEPRLAPASPASGIDTTTSLGSSAESPTALGTDEGSPLEPRLCDQQLAPEATAVTPGYAVQLTVHTPRSAQSEADLCAVLSEVNDIWWSQVGVCFEIQVLASDDAAEGALDLWFERDAPFPNGVVANGVYVSPDEIFSLDAPDLANVREPVRYPAARTSAHELGHALGLGHQDCGACDELLMRSGTKGFKLVNSEPADVDEIAVVRENLERASSGRLVEKLDENNTCAPARLPGP